MDLIPELRQHLIDTANRFKGPQRRQYMAQTCRDLKLSHRQARMQLGWHRDTLRKGEHELRSGITCIDATSARGRKPIETHLPKLLDDIRDLVNEHTQTDPTFRTTQLFCRLTAPQVRQQLIERKGYSDEQLPTVQTINTKLNVLGFRLTRVAKCRPLKKSRRPTLSSSM